jgi:hypothetical protein
MSRIPPFGGMVSQHFARNPVRVKSYSKAPVINLMRWPQTWRRAKETRLGEIDKRDWYREFPWLFEIKKGGKGLLKQFEESAELEGRDSYREDELEKLDEYLVSAELLSEGIFL